MYTQESNTRIKKNLVVYTLMALMFFCLLSLNTYAQNKTKISPYKIKLAGCDSSRISLKTILENPLVTATYPGCKVDRYYISYVPDGGDFVGPIFAKGSALPENTVNYLKEFTNMTVKIFIDSVHLNCNGKDTLANPYYFRCIP